MPHPAFNEIIQYELPHKKGECPHCPPGWYPDHYAECWDLRGPNGEKTKEQCLCESGKSHDKDLEDCADDFKREMREEGLESLIEGGSGLLGLLSADVGSMAADMSSGSLDAINALVSALDALKACKETADRKKAERDADCERM